MIVASRYGSVKWPQYISNGDFSEFVLIKHPEMPLLYTWLSTPMLNQYLFNKQRSLSRVLHCDKTRWSFENTREM